MRDYRDTLGTEAEASFISEWYQLMQKHGRWGESPARFENIGAGCYRTAFLSQDTNVVYKVEQSGYCAQSNEEEYQNLRAMMLKKLPSNIRFPKYHLWKVEGGTVAAMEYFPRLLKSYSSYGDGAPYWDARSKLCEIFPSLWDAHGGNIAVDEEAGQIIPIDLGGYYR